MLCLLIASLTALFTSFLSLSPIILNGLVPWMETVGTHPPSASPLVVLTPDLWDEFPTANLSVPVLPAAVVSIPVVSVPSVPPATPTFPPPLEEGNKEPLEMPPPPEEPTAEDQLRELWRLLKLAILCTMLSFEDFVRRNPYLPIGKPDCGLISPPDRSHSRARSVPARRIRFALRVRFRFPVRKRAVSSSPALPSVPAPVLAPAVASPTPSTSSPDQTGRPSFVERVRIGTERRKDQRILELEKQVETLNLEIAELRKLRPSPAQLVLVTGSVPPPPPPPTVAQPLLVRGSVSTPPLAQPVLVTGSVPPPPAPPATVAQPLQVRGSASTLSPSAVPFQPYSARHPAPPVSSRPPPPPLPRPQPSSFRQQHPGPRPDQFSLDDFMRKYPQTGKKLG